MTQIVNPSIDRVADSFLTAGSLAYAGLKEGGIVPSGQQTELAKQSAADETVLNGFAFSTSSSSLDVTISPGEAFVFGSWLVKDTTTTVTLPASSTISGLILTWDKNSANTVQIGIPGDFDEFPDSDEYILLGSFLTDSNGVTQSQDQREFVSVDAERLEGKDTSEITPDISDDGATVVENVDDINVEGFQAFEAFLVDDGATIVGPAEYTDSDAIGAVNNESSLSVNISGDANSVDGFSFVKDGNSGPGIINYQTGIDATGGTTVIDRTINGVDYRIHAFENVGSSTFSVNQAPADATVDVLVVGGGGGGGGRAGGGGGAGELVFRSNFVISSGSYSITVGDGGPGDSGSGTGSTNQNGDISTAFNLTAIGGGGGGGDTSGFDGGSGGGQMYSNTNPNSSGNGLSVAVDGVGNDGGFGVGNDGSTSYGSTLSGEYSAGGGGGAGQRGENAPSGFNGGDGGDGLDFSAEFGTQFGENGYFAGGGGGGTHQAANSPGLGGLGGGGDANGTEGNFPGDDGLENTGGGGGGGTTDSSDGGSGGDGGSGIVLIRYEI